MANDRLYIGNKQTKEFVFVEKGWGCGWDGGRFDAELIREFLRTTFDDGHGGSPTVLELFSEESVVYLDYFKNGEIFRRAKDGSFVTEKF